MLRVFTVLLLTTGPLLAETQPYAGQQSREAASLSETDISALLAGKGWGLAKPAELNGYPGPAHVLELTDELGLSDQQRADVQAVFDRMQADATILGKDFVQAETHLSGMFRMGHANPQMLQTMLTQSADLMAALRAVHLTAHLDVTQMLTNEQKDTYIKLRGYGEGENGTGHDAHSDH